MSSLLAFEASARTESFTRAAEQLSLTQSAVSRQVQTLEELLGVALFHRVGRRVVLTDVGRMYLRELTGPLEGIRSATLQAIAFQAGGGTLHLAVLPTFGSKWLMPRLAAFYAKHPEVLVHIHTRTYLDLDVSGMDAAIVVGDGNWPGVIAYHLVDEEMVPIIGPKQAKRDKIKTIDELLRYPLLQVVTRPTAWRDWFAKHGLVNAALNLGPRFELTSHLIQAVSAGMGIGLVPKVLVEDELRAGTLVSPADDHHDLSGSAYYLVVATNRDTYPPFVQIRDWLIGVVRRGSTSEKRPAG
ncbi:LysR substrate-binding domain-containing protein [Cupriavidus sp. PET2-C1]